MFIKLSSDWFYQMWTNSPIEDNAIAVGLQVNVSSPIANLVFKACSENNQWCKNTCRLGVGFKVCKNIHLSKITDYWVKILIGLQSSLGSACCSYPGAFHTNFDDIKYGYNQAS